MSRWGSLVIVVFGLLIIGPVPGHAAPAATSKTVTFAAVTIEPGGDFGSGGLYFDRTNATFTTNVQGFGSGNSAEITVRSTGSHISYFWFSAPSGEELKPGLYLAAERAPFADPGRPGLEVSLDNTGCDTLEGRFRVHEIKFDANGNVTSLWISFEQRCTQTTVGGWTIGDIRYKAPAKPGSIVAGPRDVWWPDEETGTADQLATVNAWNASTHPVRLGTPSISGPDARDDTIKSDNCARRTLPAGSHCAIVVGYKPLAAGDRSATLRVPESGGSWDSVSLEGFVFAGRSELSMQSNQGDYLGGGQQYDFVPANAEFFAVGSYTGVGVGTYEPKSGDSWGVAIAPPQGQTLTPGVTYTGALDYSAAQSTGFTVPTLTVHDGVQHYCYSLTGSFTVDDIYVDPQGNVDRLGIEFEAHCNGDVAALHGTLEYQLNEIGVTTKAGKVAVSGVVSPNEPGKPALVEIGRVTDSGFSLLATKKVRLSAASSYQASFARPGGTGMCEAVGVFSASDPNLASRTVKQFHC